MKDIRPSGRQITASLVCVIIIQTSFVIFLKQPDEMIQYDEH